MLQLDMNLKPYSVFAATLATVLLISALLTSAGARAQLPTMNVADGSNNLHLERTLRFQGLQPGADAARGQARFGLAADGVSEDPSDALFEGFSQVSGKEVFSNGRTCFTCHRGPEEGFGLPSPPLSASIPASDSLFTEMEADAQGDPDALFNLDQLGLVKYRPNRFDPRRQPGDPFFEVFAWRKSQKLVNARFSQGFLTDGRGRVMFETARGAVFSHTQAGDDRFDDLFPLSSANDIEAFLFGILSDPRLAALADPSDPLHETLEQRPFYTVELDTLLERRGKAVFARYCYVCHNTPNVFSSLENVEPVGNGERPVIFPSFAPPVGRMYDVGVSERNRHGLRFTRLVDGEEVPIVLPLARDDGALIEWEVTMDPGLAATSGRWEDLGRFKVPQLRNLKDNAPYFHDNSTSTLEEVVEHFTSSWYNESRDGRRYPIRLTAHQKKALLAFLERL